MAKSRIEERDELMMQLGLVVAPIQRMLDTGTVADDAIPYIESQFLADRRAFLKRVDAFCRQGGFTFARAAFAVRNALNPILNSFRRMSDTLREISDEPVAQIKMEFEAGCKRVRQAIRDIPCGDPGTILPAESPFQSYVRLRAVCASAASRLDILDPYLHPSVFHLYFGEVAANAALTVVTSHKAMQTTAKRDAIVAVSDLIARERGRSYRFLVVPSLHDRYCRADNEILHLGGSVAHAGRKDPYTISRLDSTAATHSTIDSMIANADEWFGPTVTTHRTQ